ncbi:hypothetical protein RJT34_32172 [Clitoria ternatea]|uniref:Uncharacterized protein n=1 Tax=Clitoria ternatea TaxID=43366 RepID=A0AAN9I216_CLITE
MPLNVTILLSTLSPTATLFFAIAFIDHLSLIKYVFPSERLPHWSCSFLTSDNDSCPLSDLYDSRPLSSTSSNTSFSGPIVALILIVGNIGGVPVTKRWEAYSTRLAAAQEKGKEVKREL